MNKTLDARFLGKDIVVLDMWYGHAQDVNKTIIKHNKAPKDQKHKTSNKQHDSIPMVPKESSTLAFFQILWQSLRHAILCIILPSTHKC